MWKIVYMILSITMLAVILYDMSLVGLRPLTVAVLIYVAGASAVVWQFSDGKKIQFEADAASEEKILNLLREKNFAQRQDLIPVTGLSRSTLGRLLDEMEKKGIIEQHGDRKGARYRLK